MMTSAFITILRRKYQDAPEKHRDIIQGDGSSTVFKTKFSPIKEGSFSLYVNNALQASSGYTIDYDTGDIVLASSPSTEIRSQYQSVKWRDQHWLEAIQGGFDSLGDEFWRMTVRTTAAISALVTGQQEYNGPSSCIRITEVLESDDYTTSGNWVRMNVNMRYDRRANKLILGNKPSKANYIKCSYMRRLARPGATSAVLDAEDQWLELLNIKAGEEYARSMSFKIASQGNATVEEGHLQMAQFRQLANDNLVRFDALKKKLKPVMPSMTIPFHIESGGSV